MRDKGTLASIDNSDLSNYPNGRIKNNSTPVNELVYGDIHEFFAKLMRLYGISYNGLPDNETNGYQSIEALKSLASKNDYLINLATVSGVISAPLKLGKLQNNESFIVKSSFDKSTESTIKGIDNITKTVTFEGDFKSGEYLLMISGAAGVTLTRLSTATNFNTLATELSYLKAASNAETISGTITNKAVVPASFLAGFANFIRKNDYLVTETLNGLMSAADKVKLNSLGANNDKYGFVSVGDIDDGIVGATYPVSDDLASATITTRTDEGQVIRINLTTPMPNLNYLVRITPESLGDIEFDNDIKVLVFKKLSTSQFYVYIEESTDKTQNIKLHLEIIAK